MGLFSLEKGRLWGNLAAALKGTYKTDGRRLFTTVYGDSTRGNLFKLKEGRFGLYVRKKFFTVMMVGYWHRLPTEAVDAPSVVVLRARLDGA